MNIVKEIEQILSSKSFMGDDERVTLASNTILIRFEELGLLKKDEAIPLKDKTISSKTKSPLKVGDKIKTKSHMECSAIQAGRRWENSIVKYQCGMIGFIKGYVSPNIVRVDINGHTHTWHEDMLELQMKKKDKQELKVGDRVMIKEYNKCLQIQQEEHWHDTVMINYCGSVGIITRIKNDSMCVKTDSSGCDFNWHPRMLELIK